jgi:hypothetical protein
MIAAPLLKSVVEPDDKESRRGVDWNLCHWATPRLIFPADRAGNCPATQLFFLCVKPITNTIAETHLITE